MAKKMVGGNEAVGYAALAAGAKVISGYPGTPSSEVIVTLLKRNDFPGTHVEWSTNEKVAIEVAATASWAGKRALCTMKMSGLNVAYDSMIGISHSGAVGGLVVYVCDDPGVTSGMCEQDTRGFALMSDMVMLEPSSVQETYDMIKQAFDLSEELKMPVFVRSVTCISQSHAEIDIEPRKLPDDSEPVVKKDINRYAKAGAKMCMDQHTDAINSLIKAQGMFAEQQLHDVKLGKKGGIGIITVGASNAYLDEAMEIAKGFGVKTEEVTVLTAHCTVPYPDTDIVKVLENCSTVAVAEELEPYMEREVYVQAQMNGYKTKIVGKLDNTLSRVGSFNALHLAKLLCVASGIAFDDALFTAGQEEASHALVRPITTCAGCPHRGTYMAINTAIKHAKLKKDDVIVTGDIGCTILGMNPPFNTIWMEISMGASVPCAHGFSMAGVKKPIFATMGDSTFFHGGMPGLINAIQNNTDITVIIMDNGWTAMTGMQVDPNTAQDFQYGSNNRIDLFDVVKGMGVKNLYLMDPYDQKGAVEILDECLKIRGLKVVVSRRECAIQSNRRGVKYNKVHVDAEKCVNCKLCLSTTGCSALIPGEKGVQIDAAACNGCGLCSTVCPKNAIIKEAL